MKAAFAAFIRAERARLGLSQLEVAKMIGASSATVVAQWEQGLLLPRLETFIRLGNELGQREGGWDWNEVMAGLGAIITTTRGTGHIHREMGARPPLARMMVLARSLDNRQLEFVAQMLAGISDHKPR